MSLTFFTISQGSSGYLSVANKEAEAQRSDITDPDHTASEQDAEPGVARLSVSTLHGLPVPTALGSCRLHTSSAEGDVGLQREEIIWIENHVGTYIFL